MYLFVVVHLATAHSAVSGLLANLNASTVAAIITGAVSPFAVEIMTKLHASSSIKRNVALVLAALAGVLPTVVFDSKSGWGGYVINVALALAVQQSVHRTGITAPVEQATADVGLGGNTDGTASTDLVEPPLGNPGDVGDTSGTEPPLA